MTLCVVGTGSDAVRGGAERPEPAAGFRARGSGVDAGEESDHQGSHGPVVASVGAGGKAQQAGFLQGVCILRVEADAFLLVCWRGVISHLALVSRLLHTPLLREYFHLGVFLSNRMTVIYF